MTCLILLVISELFFQEFSDFFDVLQGLVAEVGVVEGGVMPTFFQQLIVRAFLKYFAMFKHDNAVS